MKLLTKEQRKEIFERACYRFHEEGIHRLSLVGHFEKYLPLFHYTLAEPTDESHIFVTELFGNNDFNLPSLDVRTRVQYQGNYNGLNLALMTQVGHLNFPEDADLDFHINGDNASFLDRCEYDQRLHKMVTLGYNPSWRIIGKDDSIEPKLRENFDRSLKYLDWMLGFIAPGAIKTNIGSEQISKTYHVW